MCYVMTQARYSMGSARVSKLQYNEGDLDCALVRVDVRPASDSDHYYSFHPQTNIPQSNSTQLTQTELASKASGSSVNDSELAVSETRFPSGLRKRNVFPADDSSTVDSSDHGDEASLVDDMKKLAVTRKKPNKCDNNDKSALTQDPLHWFGILVPMPLRQSQAAFEHAIGVVCKIASLQVQLLDIRELYRTTLKAKHRLLASAADVGDT